MRKSWRGGRVSPEPDEIRVVWTLKTNGGGAAQASVKPPINNSR